MHLKLQEMIAAGTSASLRTWRSGRLPAGSSAASLRGTEQMAVRLVGRTLPFGSNLDF